MATKLDIALEQCLEQLRTGEATVEQCLQRHPELQEQLRPMLAAAAQVQELSEFKPRPEFRMQTRAMLHGYMRASPRRRPAFSSGLLRLATSLGVVVLALVSTGAALAQSALPGDPLYAVKLTTEQVWRNLHSDPVRADAALANRRVQEIVAVQGQAELEEISINLYAETVQQLRSAAKDDPQLTAWLNQLLLVQQDTLEELLINTDTGLYENLFELFFQPLNSTKPSPAPTPTPIAPSTPEASGAGPADKAIVATATASPLRQIIPTVLSVPASPKEETPGNQGVLPILGDAVDDTLDATLDIIKNLFGTKE
ncbi:MAG: hypothetical protein KIS80_02120 [Anaerolineales bacterium]|nr:hypothetical protein [Anaerolineales bacterium]